MKIIKEVRKAHHECKSICVIRSNGYGSQFSFIAQLVAVAKEDWPELKGEDIKVIHFGGDRYARTYGIEFDTPADKASVIDGYAEIPELEFAL